MFRSDRRWFSFAALGLLVVAIFHLLGHFAPAPADPAAAALDAALRGYVYPFGLFGRSPSAHDVLQSLSLFMALALIGWGVGHLVIAATDGPGARVVRRVALVSAIVLAPIVLVFYVYPVAPPFFCLLVVEILFLLALRPRRAAEA